MQSRTRRLVSLFVAATAFLVITGRADLKTGFSQQFENSPVTVGRERPEPVSLRGANESTTPTGSQRSTSLKELANQVPALDSEPRTEATNQSPTVADDPFDSAGNVRRVEGTGEEARGTFATSQNMLQANQSTDLNRTLSDEVQYNSPDQQNQLSPANQTLITPPITSNGLRDSALTPQATGQSSDISIMRFGDDDARDQQPQPPQAEMNGTNIQSLGQDRRQRNSSGFSNNRFTGPPDGAPPIHRAPASQWDNEPPLSTQQPNIPQTIYDSNIVPTQYQQPANESANSRSEPTSKVDLSLARKIMARYEIDNAPDPLPGRPVKLVEVLQTTPQHLQKRVINQYWETFYDWAAVLNSAQLADWLNQLPSPLNQGDIALLNAARAAARNRMLADEIQLGKSQCKLQQLMGNNDDLLPLASDLPLLQSYDSHYDWYESRNRLPENLRGIDVMLAKSIQLISNRASTVGTTRVALGQIRNSYAQNPRELGSILGAARLWNEAEQDLVSSIVSYNQAIADYSLTIAPTNTRPDEVVAMLIAKPKPAIAQQDALPTAGRDNFSTGQSNGNRQDNTIFQNAGQQRIQNASQPQSQYSQNQWPGQSDNGYRRGDDPTSRTMNPESSLSPNGYSNNRLPTASPSRAQPANSPSQPRTLQGPQYSPSNPGQPDTFLPNSAQPTAAPPGDRSAFRGNSGQSFERGNRSSFQPPVSGMSESANEFNSFGR